jgi:anthranilate synthase
VARSEAVHAHSAAPWREPLEAYAVLRAAGVRPLLLDGRGAHPLARHAYIAFDPVMELRSRGDCIEEEWYMGRRRSLRGDPLDHLRRLHEQYVLGGPAGFTGGFVGTVGYAFTYVLEPTLSGISDTTDLQLRLCTSVVAFDLDAHTAQVHTWSLKGDRAAAEARVQSIIDLLQAPAPPQAPRAQASAPWSASLDEAAFRQRVERLKQWIAEGDLFQANLATRFSAPLLADPLALFATLQAHNPSPYMALLEFDDHAVVSASPEQLFHLQHGRVTSRPIAGTRPRGADPASDDALEAELLGDAKEQAEHTMLLDLVRNDMARVAQPGSVQITECMSIERYRHVMHLTSQVEGTLRAGLGAVDVLAALFPGGTITGAPKHRACMRIAELEPVPRGDYTGSAGYLAFDGSAQFNILIRTMQLRAGHVFIHAGSGIVADSDAATEWREAGHKARALLEAATGGAGTGQPTRLGEVTRHGSWTPRAAGPPIASRVLLVDNYDSFVYNLADYCAALGAEVRVVRNDADLLGEAARHEATHVILSPGPGRPEEAGGCVEALRAWAGRVPVLGVCLGHQAMAVAHGGRVATGTPVHGKVAAIEHDGEGLFAGLPSPLEVARYHSLHVADVPPGFAVTARGGGLVMAMQDPKRRQIGVQFHPESFRTPDGMAMLRRFLEVGT